MTPAEDRPAETITPTRGMTPNEFANFIRKSPDWVRAEIAAGRLGAVNLADAKCGRPQYIILPHHIEQFIRSRSAAPPPKAPRRKRRSETKDFFPD